MKKTRKDQQSENKRKQRQDPDFAQSEHEKQKQAYADKAQQRLAAYELLTKEEKEDLKRKKAEILRKCREKKRLLKQ